MDYLRNVLNFSWNLKCKKNKKNFWLTIWAFVICACGSAQIESMIAYDRYFETICQKR